MAVFAVTYRYKNEPDTVAAHRPAHREYLRSLIGSGGLAAAGPTSGGQVASAFLLFQAQSATEIEKVLDLDPFWLEGVIESREILEWTIALGSIGLEDEH